MPRHEFDGREIRQGNQRRNVLYVLVAALALALVALFALNVFL